MVERRIGVAHAQRVLIGNCAARQADGVNGQRRFLREFAEFDLGAGPPHAATGDHHRALGRPEQLDHLLDFRTGRRGRGLRGRHGHSRRRRSALLKQVDGDGQVHRPHPPGGRLRIGAGQVERNLGGIRRLGGPFHQRPRHAELVDVLKSLAIGQRGGAAAADGDQRAAGQLGGGDAGQRVGVARAPGHQAERRLPFQSGPGIGGVGDPRFVAKIDDPDSPPRRHRQHVVQMVANQREHLGNAELLHRADKQFRSGCRSHVPKFQPVVRCPASPAAPTLRASGCCPAGGLSRAEFARGWRPESRWPAGRTTLPIPPRA